MKNKERKLMITKDQLRGAEKRERKSSTTKYFKEISRLKRSSDTQHSDQKDPQKKLQNFRTLGLKKPFCKLSEKGAKGYIQEIRN